MEEVSECSQVCLSATQQANQPYKLPYLPCTHCPCQVGVEYRQPEGKAIRANGLGHFFSHATQEKNSLHDCKNYNDEETHENRLKIFLQ